MLCNFLLVDIDHLAKEYFSLLSGLKMNKGTQIYDVDDDYEGDEAGDDDYEGDEDGDDDVCAHVESS